MAVFNPFQAQAKQYLDNGKEKLRDPLDVKELLTDGTRKAVITPDGELKLQQEKKGDKPGVELMKERYWGAESSFQAMFDKQLVLETRLMHSRFPGFEMRRAGEPFQVHGWVIASPEQMFWIGSIRTYSHASYLVAATYPPDYPFGEIYAYVVEPYLPATLHRFQDGHLCLYDHKGNGEGYEGGRTTAVTVIAWTSAWLHAYEIWRTTGKWPFLEEKK